MSDFIETSDQPRSVTGRPAPQVFTCQLTQTAYVNFPDGEILQTGGVGSQWTWPVPPFMSDAATAAWIELNYLSRPPITNLEIQMMSVSECISLYYSLRKLIPPCTIKPDPIISAGLGKFGAQHEFNLQQRIYNSRPDLHQISVGGKTYRILVPPHLLDPPPCPSSGLGMGAAGLVADIVAYFVPIVGWIYAAASIAYETYDTINQLKAAGRAADLVNEIQAGITYAKNLIHDPAPDAQTLETLRRNFAAWKSRVDQVTPLANQINIQAIHACSGITAILNSISVGNRIFAGPNGPAEYAAQWRPYENYFFSQHVYNMCFPATQSSAIPAAVAPAAVGLGLGALLLLLL
jgi:hypothetical protein